MCMYVTTSCYWDVSVTPYEGGCYLSSIIKKFTTNTICSHKDSIVAARLRGQWPNMTTADKNTILQEWGVNINYAGRYMTHYH